jgi:hypothetical protein
MSDLLCNYKAQQELDCAFVAYDCRILEINKILNLNLDVVYLIIYLNRDNYKSDNHTYMFCLFIIRYGMPYYIYLVHTSQCSYLHQQAKQVLKMITCETMILLH